MKKFIVPLYIIIVMILSGCGSMSYNAHFETKSSDSNAIEEKAEAMSWDDAKDVKVYFGKLPKGISVKESGSIKIKNRKYKLLGKIYTTREGKAQPIYWWDFPEDENWRNYYCSWQVPLVWASITIWSYVPISYPCWRFESNSEQNIQARKNRIIRTLKKAVKAAGGNVLIISSLGTLQTIDIEVGDTTSTLKMTAAEGYALKYSSRKSSKKKRRRKKR